MRKNLLIIITLIFTILFCSACSKGSTSGEKGTKAEDFSIEMNTGEEFTLSEHEGEITLISFWNTWCGACIEEMPAINRIYKEYGDKLNIISINIGEDKKTVDEFMSKKNYDFPIGYDLDSDISKKYPSEGIPYTVIIDRNGNIYETLTGSRNSDAQYKEIMRILEKVYEE